MSKAAIDIGTNTLLMLVGRKRAGGWEILRDEHNIARLGEGVDAERRIKPEAVSRAKKILAEYRKVCDSLSVEGIRAVGTSALRDAVNREEVRAELSAVIGVPVDVIEGDEEARLSFLGTIESPERSTVIDIGGGSTEIISGQDFRIESRISINIGAVRLTERYFGQLPVSGDKLASARADIRTELGKVGREAFGRLFAVAGTPTTLAAMDQGLGEFARDRIHGYVLNREKVTSLAGKLFSSSLNEILAMPGVHPKRADILPAGALILEEILAFFAQESCSVSVQGLRYGVLFES